MQNKMLVLDIDGTLLTSEHIISTKTKEALIALSKRGVYVVLASGRPTPGMLPLIKELELDQATNYFISYNGSHLNNAFTNEVLFADQIEVDTIHNFHALAEQFNGALIAYKNTGLDISKTNEWVELEARLNGMTTTIFDNVNAFQSPTPKMIIANEPEKTTAALEVAKEMYGKDFQLSISLPCFLEITSKTVDKALTLKRLCDHLQIDIQDVVTCGDGGNDISMIQAAGTGVAMDNANDTVKAAANYVTASNDHDGIVEVIETFFK